MGCSYIFISRLQGGGRAILSFMLSKLIYLLNFQFKDIQRAFLLLFLLVIVGEFFSAPAITLADTAVLHILGDNVDKYGYQRMFGSIGWGISMFIMGIALDNSVSFSNHPCGPEKLERNYIVCFMSFAILMGAALVAATQIKYPDQTIVV